MKLKTPFFKFIENHPLKIYSGLNKQLRICKQLKRIAWTFLTFDIGETNEQDSNERNSSALQEVTANQKPGAGATDMNF